MTVPSGLTVTEFVVVPTRTTLTVPYTDETLTDTIAGSLERAWVSLLILVVEHPQSIRRVSKERYFI